jgi:hypothetical protein
MAQVVDNAAKFNRIVSALKKLNGAVVAGVPDDVVNHKGVSTSFYGEIHNRADGAAPGWINRVHQTILSSTQSYVQSIIDAALEGADTIGIFDKLGKYMQSLYQKDIYLHLYDTGDLMNSVTYRVDVGSFLAGAKKS